MERFKVPLGLSVTLLLAAGARCPLGAQCPAPPGAYTMSVVTPPGPLAFCPGTTTTFDVVGASTGGAIQGFGFNITLTGMPVTVVSIVPGFAPGASGGFASNSSAAGDAICAMGFAPPAGPPLTTLATVTVTSTGFGTGTLSVAFGGSLAFASGTVPADHLVVSFCDVIYPTLTLPGGTLRCPRFIRGDCNNNGLVGGFMGDIVYIFYYLFLGGVPTPSCLDACDANDSESFDITDGVYLINWQFLGTAPPPAPFGPFPAGCGFDTTGAGTLGCQFPVCP